jgi:uncharacterized protein with HEPN domain
MTQREDPVRLRHILDAARRAPDFAAGSSRAELDEEEILALALTHLLEIIVDLRQVCDAAEKIGQYVTEGRERFLGESQGSLDRS